MIARSNGDNGDGEQAAGGVALAGRQYNTLREWTYARVRDMIVSGELAPGVEINEGRLSAQLDISKSPLREALRQLGQEGLIVSASNRSSYVSSLTEADINDIYQVRERTEVLAVELACACVTPPQIAALRANIVAMERCEAAQDLRGFGARDVEFHLLLAQIGGNRRLLRIQEGLQTEMQRLFLQQILSWGHVAHADAIVKHRAIVDALEAGDVAAAVAHIRAHIERGQQFRREDRRRVALANDAERAAR